jgi:hypothetical protein
MINNSVTLLSIPNKSNINRAYVKFKTHN